MKHPGLTNGSSCCSSHLLNLADFAKIGEGTMYQLELKFSKKDCYLEVVALLLYFAPNFYMDAKEHSGIELLRTRRVEYLKIQCSRCITIWSRYNHYDWNEPTNSLSNTKSYRVRTYVSCNLSLVTQLYTEGSTH